MSLADSEALDMQWMSLALELAKQASSHGEVPVGAVLVGADNTCIGKGWNHPISACDPTAHAEIIALRDAAKKLSNYRLPDTTLYVTLEPCPMCAGAIVHARIKRLVFATADPRSGSAGSVFDILNSQQLNHRVSITTGIMQQQCSELLKSFFQNKRNRKGS